MSLHLALLEDRPSPLLKHLIEATFRRYDPKTTRDPSGPRCLKNPKTLAMAQYGGIENKRPTLMRKDTADLRSMIGFVITPTTRAVLEGPRQVT